MSHRRRKKSNSSSQSKRVFIERLSDNIVNQHLGFISPGLAPLQSLPTLSLKLSSLTLESDDHLIYEVTCRNVQERPPNEGFNAVKRPFLPLLKCQSQDKFDHLEHPDKVAYVLSKQYNVWRQRLKKDNLSLSQYETVKNAVFQCQDNNGETGDSGHISCSTTASTKSKRKPFWHPDMKIPKLVPILEENPLGPDYLLSSSCIQMNDKVMYADHTSKLKIGRIEGDSMLHENSIEDAHLGTHSRVFGFKTYQDLTALKYQDGISVFENSSKISQILNGVEFADMNFLPFIDSILALDVDGSLVLHDYKAAQSCHQFSSDYFHEVSSYKWALLDRHPTSPFLSRILTRVNLSLFDARKRASNCMLFNIQQNQLIGGMTQSKHNPMQLYISTNLKTVLLDERYCKVSMTEWYHPNASQSSAIPHGICSSYDGQDKLEFIANYWMDSDVNLLCNDWKHELCPERFCSENSKLSCQNSQDILYPLSRGLPVKVPSLKYLLNEHLFESDYARQRLVMPWTGMTLNITDDKELKIHAVNAIGDIFEAVIEHQDHENEDLDLDPFSDLELSTTKSLDTSKFTDDYLLTDNFEMPVDKHCLNWLEFPAKLSHDHVRNLEKWEQSLPIFKKVSFVTSIYKRPALPQSMGQRLDHTIKELGLLETKKLDKKIRKSHYLTNAKTFIQKKPIKENPFCQRCYHLKETNKDKDYGPETEEILRIFEGKPLLISGSGDVTETTETSDTDDDETKSIRSRQRRLKKKSLPKGLPEDTTWTMEQFLQGLDPEMTSTQQSVFETRMETNVDHESTMDVEDSSFHDSMSKSSHSLLKKKSKKKKKKVVGF